MLKISLIWWDKFICNFKYIFINKIGFIKKKLITVEKSTKSRVLQGEARLHRALRVRDRARKFLVMRGGTEMGEVKTMRGGSEYPILRPRSAPLPSLVKIFIFKYDSFKHAFDWQLVNPSGIGCLNPWT